jgi:nucleotide-binding universal stress UspA family protein
VNTQLLLIACLIGWISVGPALSVFMGRRGHSPATWGTVGMLLGPLALPLAADAVWRRRRPLLSVLADAPAGPGPVSVLAGIDGSEEAHAALAHAVGVVGDRIGRLTLVCVASLDAATDISLLEEDEALARRWMDSARRLVPDLTAEEYVVAGRPADTLARLAAEGGYDLLVIGSRGRGLSPRLFGSVARELAGSSPVPVLIGGQGRTASMTTGLAQPPAATVDLGGQIDQSHLSEVNA